MTEIENSPEHRILVDLSPVGEFRFETKAPQGWIPVTAAYGESLRSDLARLFNILVNRGATDLHPLYTRYFKVSTVLFKIDSCLSPKCAPEQRLAYQEEHRLEIEIKEGLEDLVKLQQETIAEMSALLDSASGFARLLVSYGPKPVRRAPAQRRAKTSKRQGPY